MPLHKQETEIKLRSRWRRVVLNSLLVLAFLVLAGWLTGGIVADGREMRLLDEQIPVLESEVRVKEQDFLTKQALHEQSVKRMTPAEQVQESLELQKLRDALDRSRDLLASKTERLEEVTAERSRKVIYLIVSAIALLVLLWVNYILEY